MQVTTNPEPVFLQADYADIEIQTYEALQVQGETYDFGAGPVPAHRHHNPDGTLGGWVADTAYVAPTAYIGPDARVYDEARVYGSALVYGSARVYGSAWVYGSAQVSRTPLVLIGYEYPVTIVDNLILVGCQSGTIEEWRTKRPEDCPLLEAARESLLVLAALHMRAA